MADDLPNLRPIQVLLDTSRFIAREAPQEFRGAAKDFFDENDRGFAEHKRRITERVKGVADSLRRTKQAGGFIKVRQRPEALAKSYRPLGTLFTQSHRFALVGSDNVGELVFQTTPIALDSLAGMIEQKAELVPRTVVDPDTGETTRRVSGYRSEVGGIDDIRLYAESDRVRFSAADAVAWMRQPNVIGGYIVELFRPNRGLDPKSVDRIVAQLRAALEKMSGGLIIRPFLPSSEVPDFGLPSLAVTVQLTTDQRRFVELPFAADGEPLLISEASFPSALRGASPDLNSRRHEELLTLLSQQVLVRSVELPPALETTPANSGTDAGPVVLPPPLEGASYPVVAIIDGGVSSAPMIKAWQAGDAGLVPKGDRDEAHGTFIAGLVAGGSALNPKLSAQLEPGGCKFFDLDLFPRHELRGRYYQDIEDLFDALDEKVKLAKRESGARIFNLSFSIGTRGSRLAYSLAADRLDRLARANDVLFVVAAGNLAPSSLRSSWPEKATEAVGMLASFGGIDQNITAPAEHVLGLTVGAVNTLDVPGHVPLLPTTYTRRGPGVGGARKPELAHFGGVAAPNSQSGLISLTPTGQGTHDCGTSFSAPLVAATVATLDHRLAARAPRETLLALPVHRARRPAALNRRALRHIAREFVGFGIAPAADAILSDEPHSITLVFSDRLKAKHRLEFPFAWPRSLVRPDGACRGRAEVTLSYSPPIDRDHGDEAIRVQLEAHLHQEKLNQKTGEQVWESRLEHDTAGPLPGLSHSESYLIKTGLKWSPIKRYQLTMPEGRGNSSNWRLSLESLVRAGEAFPQKGVQFTLIMTIADLDGIAKVREELRQQIQSQGVTLVDITLAHRVRPRSST